MVLIGTEVAYFAVSFEDYTQAFSRWGDMHQHHLVLSPILKPLFRHLAKNMHRVFHMVNIQHHQSVQMCSLLLSPTSLFAVLRFCFIERSLINKNR